VEHQMSGLSHHDRRKAIAIDAALQEDFQGLGQSLSHRHVGFILPFVM
jgi:hypothetical protein